MDFQPQIKTNLESISDKNKELVALYMSTNEEKYFNALYKNNINFLMKEALLLTRNDIQKAEDLAMIVFAKAAKALKEGTYTEQEFFQAWLKRIAENTHIDIYRKETKEAKPSVKETSEGESFLLQKVDTELNPHQETERNNMREIILKNIGRLAPDLSVVAKLRFLEEYEYQEIADELEIPLNTVKTRIRKAKELLTESMPEYKDSKNIE